MATLVSLTDRSTDLSEQRSSSAPGRVLFENSSSIRRGSEPKEGEGIRGSEPRRRPSTGRRETATAREGGTSTPHAPGLNELTMLTRTFHTMAAHMQKREAHLQAALRRERAISTTLQAAFLPQSLPTCPGYAFAAGYHPALREAEVGGDFYDLFRLPGERMGLLLGDVSGKGLGAATYATMARYTLRAYALQGESPGEVLARANAALCESIDDPAVFVTAAYAILDPATHILTCAAAGHWPALLVRGVETEVVGGPSLALGVSSEGAYDEERRRLEPGDRFLLYTDGLVEIGAEDPMDHLESVRKRLPRRGETPEAMVARLYQDALRRSRGTLRDDVALLALRREPGRT